MKDLKFLYILLSLFLFICSCSKEKLPNNWNWNYWGEVNSMKDGKEWEARIYGHKESAPTKIGFALNIDHFDDFDFYDANLYIYRIPKKVGKYTTVKSSPRDRLDKPGATFFNVIGDGDVVSSYFEPIDSLKNYIKITAIDGDEIWGNFQFTMLRSGIRPGVQPTAKDTLRFTEGYFHTRLHD